METGRVGLEGKSTIRKTTQRCSYTFECCPRPATKQSLLVPFARRPGGVPPMVFLPIGPTLFCSGYAWVPGGCRLSAGHLPEALEASVVDVLPAQALQPEDT